jgi:Family of unknown function (DUF6188)
MDDEKFIGTWLEDCRVVQIGFRGGFGLNLSGDNQLLVSAPLRLTVPATETLPAEIFTIDPYETSRWERPLFDFAGSTCTDVAWDDHGDLHLKFSSGHEIEVSPAEDVPAWELFVGSRGYAVCLPGGEVQTVQFDPATVELMKKRRARGAPTATSGIRPTPKAP